MELIPIKLPKGKYLSQIEPFLSEGLDTDCIYNKTIPGCGISHYAITYFESNLIGLLPNRPVIEDKVAIHNKNNPNAPILGVYKGISTANVKAYLLSDIKYKKILTTPEGFMDKVIKAFEDREVMRTNFFMFVDECERIITDISYRGKIAAPLNEVFKFRRKAFVSATVLPYSDERFKDFKYYVIEPQFDYSKPITVINSNNVVASFNKLISQLKSKNLCIFLNSTNGIAAITRNLDIRKQSKAFCSSDSAVALKSKHFQNAYSHFEKDAMSDYNFFTSRYFSAYDIHLDYKPDVILISDIYFADHSILDPQTEVIQIAGRFRNGINSLTQITNFDPQLEVKSIDELMFYLKGCFDTYEGFVNSYNTAVHPGVKDSFRVAIDTSIARPFYIDGKINSFMIDNAIHEERVKGYYQQFENLQLVYAALELHFKPTYQVDEFAISDADLYNLKLKVSKEEKLRAAALLLDKLTSKWNKLVMFADEEKASIAKLYPEIYEAYHLIGLDGLETTGYVIGAVNKAIAKARKIKELKRLAPLVQSTFAEHSLAIESDILTSITELYTKYNCSRKITAADIRKYFNARRTQSGGQNAYALGSKIDVLAIQNY